MQTSRDFERLMRDADAAGLRLEMVRGIPTCFCREPDELDSEVTLLPEAVIEVLSEEYEAKDLLIGVPFYRQTGIRDIVVFDPRTGDVRHWQQGQPERPYASPAPLTFLCGCTATV